MSTELNNSLALLHRLARSVRAVNDSEANPFSRAIAALGGVAEAMQSPIAIVGGLAGIYYQTQVTTLDIDIIVEQNKLDDFLDHVAAAGFEVERRSEQGWHRLAFVDGDERLIIEVIPEGGRSPRDPAHAPAVPSPQQVGVSNGIGYASFGSWVVLKLVANREKDRYHLVEALKRADESQIAAAVVQLRKLDKQYLVEFERLVRNAEDEKSDHW